VTASLSPRVSVDVELHPTCVIDVTYPKRSGVEPQRPGIVWVGGQGFGSVRIAGAPDALRRLADALTQAADIERRSTATDV